MTQKIILVAAFFLSASLLYFVSPSWGCGGVATTCVITCYNSSGQQIGAPESCVDSTIAPHSSCECDTEYDGNGNAACHSRCSSTTGQDTYCVF